MFYSCSLFACVLDPRSAQFFHFLVSACHYLSKKLLYPRHLHLAPGNTWVLPHLSITPATCLPQPFTQIGALSASRIFALDVICATLICNMHYQMLLRCQNLPRGAEEDGVWCMTRELLGLLLEAEQSFIFNV